MPSLSSASSAGAPLGTFHKFVEFSRLVEKKDEAPTVYGIATWERADSDNEICDYESAVPVYQAWSKKALQRTRGAGQEISLGNIRLMHGAEVGGKVTSIDFRDDAKEIAVGSEPVDDAVYKQLKGGFLTGYSQGGSYAWRECEDCRLSLPLQQGMNFCTDCGKLVAVRYGLRRLAEISYVDSPAIGEGFEHVKAGGSSEIIKFKKHKEKPVANKTKKIRGEELPAAAFAYAGDPDNPDTWILPIALSTAEKTATSIRRAVRKMASLAGVPAAAHTEARARIQTAAKAAGIDPAAEAAALEKRLESAREALRAGIDKAAEAKGFRKGLYAVGRFADILESLAYLYESSVYEREIEGDESDVPDELKVQLQGLIETFISMAEEEARELAANKNDSPTGATKTMTPEQLEAFNKAAEAAKRSMMSHFAKAASHHEKMAGKHEAIADEHEAAAEQHTKMAEACDTAAKATKAAGADGVAKEDVSETPEHDAIHEVLSLQQNFHKSMAGSESKKAKAHDGIAAAHDKFAEHNRKMAEASDDSADKAESAALLKSLSDEADPPPATPTAPTMDDDVAKAAAALRDTPDYKKSIAEIAQARVNAEVEEIRKKTLAPLGIDLLDPKLGKAAAPGSLAAVKRGDDAASEFEFATTKSVSNTGGL